MLLLLSLTGVGTHIHRGTLPPEAKVLTTTLKCCLVLLLDYLTDGTNALCDKIVNHFPMFDDIVLHKELCISVIMQLYYFYIQRNPPILV